MPKTMDRREVGFETRAFGLIPKSYSEDDHSVQAVLATDSPVFVYDWDRGIVKEVLLMAGLRGVKVGDTIPLLDSHHRDRSDDQIGTTVIEAIEENQAIGRRRFSQVNPRAVLIEGMVSEGHLRDGSVGYIVEKYEWVEEGRTRKIKGREFAGPVKVVTSWRFLEDSTTPIGADPKAKVRSGLTAEDTEQEDEDMIEEIRKELEAKGMEPEASDEEMVEFLRSLAVVVEGNGDPAPTTTTSTDPVEGDSPETQSEDERALGAADERARVTAIMEMCALAGMSDKANKFVADETTVDEARKALLAEAEKAGRFGGQPVGPAPQARSVSLEDVDDEEFAGMINSAGLMK